MGDSDHSTPKLGDQPGEGDRRSLLPVHPHPIEGELLSSWMHRLATSLGMELPELWRWVRGDRQPDVSKDMDRTVSLELLDELHQCTGISRDVLWQLTLPALMPLFCAEPACSGWSSSRPITPWVGRVGYDNAGYGLYPYKTYGDVPPSSDRRYFGLLFCPDCLATDSRPYFRRIWRLAWSVVCVKHRVVLQDRCYRCGHPISFGRATRGGGPVRRPVIDRILRCAQCDAYRDEAPRVDALDNDVEHQHARDIVLQQKIAKLPHIGGAVAAPYYFAMLHSLCSLLRGFTDQDRDFQLVAYEWAKVRFVKPAWQTLSQRVVSLTLATRRPALNVATAILTGWPNSLTEILWRLPNGPETAVDTFAFNSWLHQFLSDSHYKDMFRADELQFSAFNAIRKRLGMPIAERLPIAEELDSPSALGGFESRAEKVMQMISMHAPSQYPGATHGFR